MYGYFPTTNNSVWINMNLRVYFTTYILLNGWVGSLYVDSNPSFTMFYSYPNVMSNLTVTFLNTTDVLYLYMAEFRVFELNTNFSWGEFFKYSYGIWPPLPGGYFNQRQYITAYGNIMFLDISNANMNMSISSTTSILFNVPRCTYG